MEIPFHCRNNPFRFSRSPSKTCHCITPPWKPRAPWRCARSRSRTPGTRRNSRIDLSRKCRRPQMIRLASFAALLAIAASLLAQSALDQLRAYKDGNAAPAQAAQQALAAAGARAQKYDILGIKVGMTIQEALASLKAYNANFRLK